MNQPWPVQLASQNAMYAQYLSQLDWVLLLKLGGIAMLMLGFLAREIIALRQSVRFLQQEILRAENQQVALEQKHRQDLLCASKRLRFHFPPQNPPCP